MSALSLNTTSLTEQVESSRAQQKACVLYMAGKTKVMSPKSTRHVWQVLYQHILGGRAALAQPVCRRGDSTGLIRSTLLQTTLQQRGCGDAETAAREAHVSSSS